MTDRYVLWRNACEAAVRAGRALGAEPVSLSIAPPATDAEVVVVERALGVSLPASLRRVLTEFSSAFELRWFLPDGADVPFEGIFSGQMTWGLSKLVEIEENRRDWVRNVFPNVDDPYDRVWHDKLAIHDVGNGDLVALDLRQQGTPLVYVSHDDGAGHGYLLGRDFEDALDRWLPLGCVGAEDWQWMPFVTSKDSGLDPEGANAKRWRHWFGIDAQLRAAGRS